MEFTEYETPEYQANISLLVPTVETCNFLEWEKETIFSMIDDFTGENIIIIPTSQRSYWFCEDDNTLQLYSPTFGEIAIDLCQKMQISHAILMELLARFVKDEQVKFDNTAEIIAQYYLFMKNQNLL